MQKILAGAEGETTRPGVYLGAGRGAHEPSQNAPRCKPVIPTSVSCANSKKPASDVIMPRPHEEFSRPAGVVKSERCYNDATHEEATDLFKIKPPDCHVPEPTTSE